MLKHLFLLTLVILYVAISVCIYMYVMLGQNTPDAHADTCEGVPRWEMLVCNALLANEEDVFDGWGMDVRTSFSRGGPDEEQSEC